MACIGDILHLIEAQDVGGEGSQASEYAGIATDAAGILGEAAVTDIVVAVFDAPVIADDLGAGGGWQDDVADEQGALAGGPPHPGGSGAGEDIACDTDRRVDQASPFGVSQMIAKREHLDQAGFVAATALLVDAARTLEWCRGLAQRGEGVMQGGLVGLDLGDQRHAACGGLLEGFYGMARSSFLRR